jgi:hypothetical protein
MKLLLAAVFVGTLALVPVMASASTKKPTPITASQMSKIVQGEVNTQFHSDKVKGENTSCTYVEKKMKVGYAFKCFTYNKSGTKIASTSITITPPEGKDWTWNYSVTPITPSLSNSAKATYIVTGPAGTKATITIYDVSGSFTKNNVTLPFSMTEVGGNSASLSALDLSGSNKASITCEIKEPPAPIAKTTGTGPYAFASCL